MDAHLQYELVGRVPSLVKLIKLETLSKLTKQLKEKGNKIVWTNGCFDILHPGHIIYLQGAKQKGDILVVGLNSDASVKQNKGDKRPVFNELERAINISALECVDYVTLIEDKEMIKPLELLRPDVYAKGGDYNINTINQNERRLVESYGGKIEIISSGIDISTTKAIEKIIEAYAKI